MRHGLSQRALLLIFIAVALAHAAMIFFFFTGFSSPQPKLFPLEIDIRKISVQTAASPAGRVQTTDKHAQSAPASAHPIVPAPTAPKAAGQGSVLPSAAHTQQVATTGASGTSTSPPDHQAAHLKNPAPHYPPLAQKRGWQGGVVLRVRVLRNGKPDEIRIQASSGFALLDEAAIDTVRHWRFIPALRGDFAIDGWVLVPIEFKLHDN